MSPETSQKFEIVTTTAGAVSIKNNLVNEIMHNPVGPWVEANALYVEQSRLRDRLLLNQSEPLVVFDVGLGAAANALAAIACAESLGPESRSLTIISFEKDLELLEFTLKNAHHFPHIQSKQNELRELIANGQWHNDKITWILRKGEFHELIQNESHSAEIVFFDPYSPAVNEEMWTISTFKSLRSKMKSKESGGVLLLTYSQATRVRAAMICAGLRVGYGSSTGLKEQTTQAATSDALLAKPLDGVWFTRWERSHSKYPIDVKIEDRQIIDAAIVNYQKSL